MISGEYVLDLRMELARTNTGDAMRTLTLSKKDTQGEIQKKGHDAVEFAALDYSRHEDVSWWTIDPVIEPSIKPTGETNVREALKALETAEGQLRTFDVETFPTLYEVKDAFFQKPEITQTASMVASARLIQGNLTQAMASMGILLGK